MDTKNDTDYYAVLKLDHEASEDAINKAARKLSLKYHPDKNPDPSAAIIFQSIQEAKEFLLDKDKRKEYDDKLRADLKRKSYENERMSKMGESRKRFKADLEAKLKTASVDDTNINTNYTNTQQQQAQSEFNVDSSKTWKKKYEGMDLGEQQQFQQGERSSSGNKIRSSKSHASILTSKKDYRTNDMNDNNGGLSKSKKPKYDIYSNQLANGNIRTEIPNTYNDFIAKERRVLESMEV